MKIVCIGAASYVFGPTVLLDALVKHRIVGELALVDLNLESAEAMAGVGRRIATDLGVDCIVKATDDRRSVLRDADFVILSAAPEGRRRWWMDYALLKQHKLPYQARECAGMGGLSYALRTISMALDICQDMEALCPDAVLLNVTNPMPRVISAVNRFTKIRAFGFCNVAYGGAEGYEWLARLVQRPFQKLDVMTAGLNHFAWLVSIHDTDTGEDLYHEVIKTIQERAGNDFELYRQWLETYGAVGVSGANHMAEFLPFNQLAQYASQPPYHGNQNERMTRMQTLLEIGNGELDWSGIFKGGSWEHPVDVAVAMYTGGLAKFDMLNLPNAGYLPELPDGRIVEVPVTIENSQIKGIKVGVLPGEAGTLCKRISDVHALVAIGAATGRRECLHEAIHQDPAITEKQTAHSVLNELLLLHADLLPRFSP